MRSIERKASGGEAAAGSKNLIVIILDTVRATNLHLYGYSRPTTPEIERYAARAVIFDQGFRDSTVDVADARDSVHGPLAARAVHELRSPARALLHDPRGRPKAATRPATPRSLA